MLNGTARYTAEVAESKYMVRASRYGAGSGAFPTNAYELALYCWTMKRTLGSLGTALPPHAI